MVRKIYNYKQYCKDYPQYFNCENSEYDEEYYRNIQNNWSDFINERQSFEEGHSFNVVSSGRTPISLTDYIEIKGNIKLTTYNSYWSSAFTLCLYDKNKNPITGMPTDDETLSELVTRNISFKDGFYMRFRSNTGAFTAPGDAIYVKIEKGD